MRPNQVKIPFLITRKSLDEAQAAAWTFENVMEKRIRVQEIWRSQCRPNRCPGPHGAYTSLPLRHIEIWM